MRFSYSRVGRPVVKMGKGHQRGAGFLPRVGLRGQRDPRTCQSRQLFSLELLQGPEYRIAFTLMEQSHGVLELGKNLEVT